MRFWSGWVASPEGRKRHLSGTSILLLRKTVKGGVKLDHFGGAKVDQLVKG